MDGNAYYMAVPDKSGDPGQPIGDEETGAILVFDDLSKVQAARKRLVAEYGDEKLKIFGLTITACGEVIA